MSYTEIRSNAVTVRKPHACVWCGQRINVGEAAQYRAYVFDGDFQHDWMHPECHHAMETYPDQEYLWDGWMMGEFERPAPLVAAPQGENSNG